MSRIPAAAGISHGHGHTLMASEASPSQPLDRIPPRAWHRRPVGLLLLAAFVGCDTAPPSPSPAVADAARLPATPDPTAPSPRPAPIPAPTAVPPPPEPPPTDGPPAAADSATFRVVADEFAVDPPSIRVSAGAAVSLTFVVKTEGVYFGGIDFRSDVVDSDTILAGTEKTITFTAPAETFSFTAYWPATGVPKQATLTVEID